jgi:hypothetical protein
MTANNYIPVMALSRQISPDSKAIFYVQTSFHPCKKEKQPQKEIQIL